MLFLFLKWILMSILNKIYALFPTLSYLSLFLTQPSLLLILKIVYQFEWLDRFDILVNGGGAVVLQFQRNPFHPIKRTILVPWNDIIVMLNPVVMSSAPTDDTDSQHTDPLNTGLCLIHHTL